MRTKVRVQENYLARDARVPALGMAIGLAETILGSVINGCAFSKPVKMHLLP